MSTVTVTGDHIEIRFSAAEKVAGLIRDQRIPLQTVTGVAVVDDAIAATRGIRAPGLGLPGLRKIGAWRGPGHTQLVCVRRGEPAVRLELSGHRFDSVLIGAPDAEAVAAEVRSRLSR